MVIESESGVRVCLCPIPVLTMLRGRATGHASAEKVYSAIATCLSKLARCCNELLIAVSWFAFPPDGSFSPAQP